jgi:hypothetical protein
MIWASHTLTRKMAFRAAKNDDGPNEEDMGLLMATVRGKLIEKALSLDRSNNAILGVQFQVVNDSLAIDPAAPVIRQITVVASGTPGTVISDDVEANGRPVVSAPLQENESTVVMAEAVVLS